ncbi:luc7-like protein 3 isoform X1 [Salmo trutta]|uniref:LUC7-like 3 pre-mRNA splicing factor n=1 Tax=Salmo trutta TaxID=8032 RepID=A0A673YHX4_SALTR|nr:luc7-like protein 3 isoform X1 [Salmo trutta]XP_029626451.1 luc7-like protein 3 isoform X1 [Salmo trutta]
MLSAAQLLDELMGRDRNLAPDEKRCNVRWDHETTCKYYLCGFCPAELFTNTRSDLGPCEKIHDENLRKMYEKSSRFMKEGYERDFLRYLQSLLAEVERRIRRGHARLALSQAQQAAGQGPGGPVGKNEEKATVLTEKIEDLVMQIEELGSEGRVEEAQGMMKLVEQLKDERELLSSTPSTIETFAAQEKQMEVCEVCGAFLIVGDAQSRVDDHLMGKQHMGYAKIKSTVEELKEKLNRRSEDPAGEDKGELESKDWERDREERETKRKLEEEEKEKEKEKEREKEKEKERERVKEREKEREREKRGRRSHSNSRHSSRASDRKRSRSRERRRSRSKERERKRSRSRDRDRERRRSRERSDRKRRSRSRERKRSRSSERKSHRHRSRSRDKDRTSRDKERKEPEERRSSSKKDEVLEDDKPSSDVAKPGPVEAEAPASTLGLALLARVNGAAQDDLHSEGDTQSN